MKISKASTIYTDKFYFIPIFEIYWWRTDKILAARFSFLNKSWWIHFNF